MTNNIEDIDTSIPSLKLKRMQRLYYPQHFRSCVKILGVMIIINLILLLAILYYFFTRPAELEYATAFNGKVTRIDNTSLEQAQAVTKQHQNDGQ